MKPQFENLKYIGEDAATPNLNPGKKVYGERLIKKSGTEYRIWDPYRSKMSAAIKQGLKHFPVNEDSEILYLGAGNGTTASHLSDLCTKGTIYCVEFSPRAMLDLFEVCKTRKNMIPILADANKPQEYMSRIGLVDVVYQDVAQKFQVDILNKNADYFLRKNGWIFLMVKARSFDVTKEPKKVFNIVYSQLATKYKIMERIELDPYERDHMCINGKLR